MKTENAIRSKWMRRVSGLLATLMLMMSFAGQASAIILFQDDATHDIDSEGIIINADDGGDEDATLQFGNDGSDATITFDDGLDKLIYSGAGMDWSSVDMFRIREDADPAGNAACGFKGELIYDTTDDELQICTVVGGAGAATWVAVNSGSDADTLDTLDSTDFLRATASDAFGDGGVYTLTIGADDTLQVDGTFDANGVVAIGDGGDTVTINGTTGDWDLTDLDFDITGNPSEITLVSDGAADDFTIELTGATDSSLVLQSTGTGTDAVDINATAGGVTVDASGAVSLDGGAASNFTTSAGALTLDGAGGVNIAGNAAEVDVTTTGALDLNSGAFTWDGSTALMTSTSTFGIDSTGAVTIDSDAATTLGGATIGIDSDGGAVSINNNVNQNVNIGTGTSTGVVNIGGGAGTVSINTTSWDISTAGIATGFTGITSTGVVNFSGASRLALHQGANNPAPCTEGDIFYNTTGDTTYVCTVTGNPGTWTALSSGGADTFETVYGADADKTLTTANGAFSIAAGSGALAFDSGTLSVDSTDTTNITMTANDAGAKTFTIDAINGGAGTGNLDINADDAITVDSTSAGISLDGAAASNFTTSAGALTLDGAGGVNIAGNAAEVDVTTTGALDLNSGAFTWDGSTALMTSTSTFGIDSTGAVTIDSDAASTLSGAGVSVTSDGGALALTGDGANDIDIANAGAAIDVDSATMSITTTGQTAIDTSTWDISGAGVGSEFTGFTSTGVVNFSGSSSFRIREVADEAAATCTTVNEIVLDTTEDKLYVCTGVGAPGTWTAAADKVDTMVFEPEYPNYVLWGDGVNNNGKMEALYDSANGEQYYRWTTKKNAQHDYDIRFRYTLPDDYSGAGNMVLRLRNDTNVAADNALQVFTVRNDTDNQVCHADGSTTAAAANTWQNVTITGAEIETGCTGATALDPGDVVEVIMQLMANETNSGGTDVGTLSFAYTN